MHAPTRPLVVVPTYDEADNIVTLLARLRAAAPGADVLVVDDDSPDGTGDLVGGFAASDPGVHLLRGSAKRGLGAAYRSGFSWALARDYDAVVQMDADLSHPPEQVPALLAALARADIAVGSRYVKGGRVTGWPLTRRTISAGGNLYARIMLGLSVHDVTAGFKAFRRQALITCGARESDSEGYCFQIETTWRAVRRGLRVVEVPIAFTDRTRGTSKMSGSIASEAMVRVAAWRWAELTSPRAAEAAQAAQAGQTGPAGRARRSGHRRETAPTAGS